MMSPVWLLNVVQHAVLKYECMRQCAADDKWTECELVVNFGKIHIDPVT